MDISIPKPSELTSYEILGSLIVASCILFLVYAPIYNKNKERDRELFKQPPPQFEDCPICFIRLPSLNSGSKYMACCGKVICCGCAYAVKEKRVASKLLCPFCRTPAPTSEEEVIKRMDKRMEANDANAFFNRGCDYLYGMNGTLVDMDKALELFYQACELGHAGAHHNVGCVYVNTNGHGVKRDRKKAVHYYELAATKGDIDARNSLGLIDKHSGNYERALKHFMIAVESGNDDSLKQINQLYSKGYATKDDYTTALRSYQTYLGEIKSVQRDKAAAFDESEYRYY